MLILVIYGIKACTNDNSIFNLLEYVSYQVFGRVLKLNVECESE